MKRTKRIISVLLTLVMILSALPLTSLTAFAASSGDFEYTVLSETEKTCEITKYTGSTADLIIPSQLDGYTVSQIKSYTFIRCASLKSVILPSSVAKIGDSAFEECISLTSITIPDGVTSIGYSCFRGCASLTNITIPRSVINIYSGAFEGCPILIDVSKDNQVYSSMDGVLFNKDKTELIIYPEGKTNAEYIVPNSVIKIGSGAFEKCTSLISIIIPDAVTSIQSYTFMNCSSLTNITIPKNITEVGYLAFHGTGFYNTASNWEDDMLYIGDCLVAVKKELSGACTIKAGTKVIADQAFEYCDKLESITIPDGITKIGEELFFFCTSLESVTISNSVTSIGSGAFWGCTSLESVTIPESVTSIGSRAFYNCAVRFTVYGYVDSAAESYANENGLIFVALNVPKFTLGDVNEDCQVTAIDARWALQAASGTRELTDEQILATDVNGDGKVTAVDARWILQAASGSRVL